MRSLRQWFDIVLDLTDSARDAWIDHNIEDLETRARLRALLEAHDRGAPGLIDLPVRAVLEAISTDDVLPEPEIGTRIGAFRLLELVGRGGMAAVFLAERENVDFVQRVAVKLLRRGLHSELQQQLFRRERRLLAALSHPDIARLIDGGVTEHGLPFLVMDYVDGKPITHYASAHHLDVRERLRLFGRVCRAVEAAHRQLVVHRDLKPSNILVDAEGAPKLLDFGIAALAQDSGQAETDALPHALTPGYAAPEQYTGGPISTATDVYALGVLLHELLLGTRPEATHASGTSRGRRASHNGDRPRDDLDWIIFKAMRPDPRQRYASAGALADDVERQLRNEPVAARTPTALYRARKFIRRHRGGVSIASVLALGLFASLAVALWQARIAGIEAKRAQVQARIAQMQSQRANAVRDLLVGLFENEAPGRAQKEMPDTATLLQRGARRARSELANSPALQVEMLVVIGRIYDQLSRYQDARPLLEQAVEVARRLPASERDALGVALSQRGQLNADEDRFRRAIADFDAALAIQRALHPQGVATALTLHRRAEALSETGRHAPAIADHLASIAILEQALPATDARLLRGYGALGTAYTRANRATEALPWQQRALRLARAHFGTNHVETARRLSNYGNALLSAGRLSDAQAPMAEAAAIMRRVHRGPHGDLAWTQHNHASVLLALGDIDRAGTLLRQSIAMERSIGRGQTAGVGFSLGKLGRIEELRGNLEAALMLAGQSRDVLASALPPEHEQRLEAELRIMQLRLLRGSVSDLREEAMALRQRVDALGLTKLSAQALFVQGLAHAQAGDDPGASPLIARAVSHVSAPRGFAYEVLGWYATLAETRQRTGDTNGAAAARRDARAYAAKWGVPATHPAWTRWRIAKR